MTDFRTAKIDISPVDGGGQVFNVKNKSIGAAVDGYTDDAAYVAVAVAKATMAGGGIILVPGLCAIGAAGILLDGLSNIVFVFANGGGFVALAQSTLDYPSTGGVGCIVAFNDCVRCGVQGGIWNGGGFETKAIGMQGCSNMMIEGTEGYDFGSSAANRAVVMSFGGSRNTYKDNVIHDTTDQCRGMWIGNTNAGEEENYPTVQANLVYDTGFTGIGGTSIGGSYVGNKVTGAGGSGIALGAVSTHYAEQITVQANICSHNALHGIQADASAGSLTKFSNIIGNECNYNDGAGIYAIRTQDWSLVGNVCLDNNQSGYDTGPGIQVEDSDGVEVIGNICVDDQETATQTHGILVQANGDDLANVDLIGNQCRGNVNDGILVQNAPGKTVDGVTLVTNRCTENGRDGIRVADAAPGDITRVVWRDNQCWDNATNDMRNDPTDSIINGLAHESADAEMPTAANWNPGNIVKFTDTGDASGDGVYILGLDGSWTQLA